jgi:hypothetical protein
MRGSKWFDGIEGHQITTKFDRGVFSALPNVKVLGG